MMNEAFLSVNVDSLKISQGGLATADIWLVLGDHEFPMHGWNDFVVVILSWWHSALLRLLQDASIGEMLHFMDGPYAVEVSISSDVLKFRALEGSARNREVAIANRLLNSFAKDLILRSREIIEACRLQGWWSKDLDTLSSLVEELGKKILLH